MRNEKLEMKKLIPIILILTLFLSSCGFETAEENKKLKVCTSFYAVYDFANTVGGDYIELTNIVPSSAEPHDFEPTAKGMAELTEADIFIYSGAGMEHWAADVAKTLPDTVTVVCLADYTDETIIAEGDPHVWLSPYAAMSELYTISAFFASKDSKNAGAYEQRCNDYARQIEELYGEYANAGFDGKKLFVTHGAYGYLCRDFGMEQHALEGISGDVDPTPSKMAEIVENIKAENAKCIFYDPLEGDKLAAAVAAEAGVFALPLSTFEGDGENRDYITVMRENLEQLKKGLN